MTIRKGAALPRLSNCYKLARPYDRGIPPCIAPMFIGPFYTIYVRGLAYLAAHQGAEAAAEFQKILDHRAIVVSDPIGALAHLQLGRALACREIRPRQRPPTRISSPSGKTPTRTSPSLSKPRKNSRRYLSFRFV